MTRDQTLYCNIALSCEVLQEKKFDSFIQCLEELARTHGFSSGLWECNYPLMLKCSPLHLYCSKNVEEGVGGGYPGKDFETA